MIEALIGADWMRGGVKVIWRMTADGQRPVYTNGIMNQVAENGVEITIEPLVLSDEHARALLGSLIRHYEGGEDTRSLRRDYDAERKRVDLLIGNLIGGPSDDTVLSRVRDRLATAEVVSAEQRAGDAQQ